MAVLIIFPDDHPFQVIEGIDTSLRVRFHKSGHIRVRMIRTGENFDRIYHRHPNGRWQYMGTAAAGRAPNKRFGWRGKTEFLDAIELIQAALDDYQQSQDIQTHQS